jgi:phage shock protein A
MASIINSIAFKNFFNYYGDFDDTQYDFEEGINLVVADNGAGKSKFFNAFLWLFNDQVLDSDDKIKKSVRDIAVKIISDKAKIETPIGENVETGIQVEYSTSRYKYLIKKSLRATRIRENITDELSWQIILNDVEVYRTDHVLPKYTPIYDMEEKATIIKQLILPNLRQYSFLQGEEVDSIIDFGNRSSIETAVRTLTNITHYEVLATFAKEFKDKAYKDLNAKTKSNDDHNERLDKAIQLKETYDNNLSNEEFRLSEFEKLYEDAEKEKNELEQNFSNAKKRQELDDQIKDKNKSHSDLAEEYTSFLDNINNRFFDGNFSWIAYGFQSVVNDFQEKIQAFREGHYEKKALQAIERDPNKHFHFLPVNSPDSVSLKNMIDHEHCYVCNRPAKKGSDEYEFILKLKNRPSEPKSDDFVKNNLEDFFGGLQINAQPFYNRIDTIDDSVLQTVEREAYLNERLSKVKRELKSLRDQRKDIIIAGSDDEDALAIINRYKGAIRRIESSSMQIERLRGNIKKMKSDIANLEKEISSLRPTNLPEGYTLNYQIASDLLLSITKAKDRIFDNMVKLLEKYANEHFQALIKYNDLAGGILKFQKSPSGSILFNYIDSNNHVVHGSSEGFQRMKKFAVVMSVISVNTTQYNYPLLADAPISAFGEGFAEGFFEAVGKVFPQSIILVKELYSASDPMKINELGKKLLKDPFVKTMYVNQINEGAEQVDLVTKKIKLK